MKWVKTILIGILATFAMDVSMKILMNTLGLMPTNIHPAAAFLYNLGIQSNYFSLILHYCYGILWTLVFVYAFEFNFSVKKAVILSLVLWIFMMTVYSPVIGWGFFGVGNARLLDNSHPLFVSSTIEFIALTLSIHICYGLTLGILTKKIFPNYKGKTQPAQPV